MEKQRIPVNGSCHKYIYTDLATFYRISAMQYAESVSL